jgi:hypothetical protein
MTTEELLLIERQARFDRILGEMLREKHTMGEAGIGTLGEKRLHLAIKRFLCENEDYHEVGVANTRFVSDVRIGNDIYEVQTGPFYPMRTKLTHYLENTDCTVTVVHPIAVHRWISWLDPKTGEITQRTRVSKKGRPEDLLAELYPLIPLLGNPRLHFRLLMIDAQDFRLLSTRSRNPKKGAKKYERIPLALLDDITFSAPQDFAPMIPDALPAHFTVKTFSDLTKIRGRDAYSAVRALCALGLFAPADPIGRSMGFVRL